MPRLFKPSDIEKLTGLSTGSQRDLRGRSILNGIGVADDSGRWTYDEEDAVAIWFGRYLSAQEVMNRSVAYSVAQNHSSEVLAAVTGHPLERPFVTVKVFIREDGDLIHQAGASEKTWSALSEIPKGYNAFTVINLQEIAKSVPEILRDQIRQGH